MARVIIEGFESIEEAVKWLAAYECEGEDALYNYFDTLGEQGQSYLEMKPFPNINNYYKVDIHNEKLTVVMKPLREKE